MPDAPRQPAPPNIIVILVDDMGYSDIGCFGSEIRTPNLNRLAAEGARMTQMTNCARCCPSRASLLTGLYPHQAGVGAMVGDGGQPGYRGFLNDRCVTIAEALKPAGYRTLMSGKWHVGGSYTYNKPETWTPGDVGHPLPVQRGFDEHYGTLGGGGSYFKPPTLIHNDMLVEPQGDAYYYTDAISEHACRMIDGAVADAKPFFLYTAYTAPHWPLHALPEDITRYEGLYAKGWDTLRAGRHEEQKGMGLLDSRWPISPRDEQAPAWPDVTHRDWEALRMAVYAAQVDRMDQGVGRILAALDKHGIADDTLVVFLSDNGGCAEFLAEDGPQCPQRFDIPTRDGRPMRIGNTPAIQPGPADTFASYDLPWANASNTPFRFFKKWVHEGGISTPLVARWPGRVAADHISHAPAHVIDIMATCLDAAGVAYPKEHNGRAVKPLEGESLLPTLGGNAWSRERRLFYEHIGNRAVRDGEWKLVSAKGGPWELYNMIEDRTEVNDLADSEAARLAELIALYDAWAVRADVVPRST